jgi:acetoacetyl-CoA synthetase
MTTPLWTPDRARVDATTLVRFTTFLSARVGRPFADYASLHAYSITERGEFWSAVWDFCGVIGDKGAHTVVQTDHMPGAQFFPDARLNFAENVLRGADDAVAIIAVDEPGTERTMTRAELRMQVAACARMFMDAGVQPGDRVAGVMANVPEAVVAALAAASLGAVWSSCSPDFGVQGILDRFGQIEPTVLVAVAGYHYGGKYHDCRQKVGEVAAKLPSLRATFIVPDWNLGPAFAKATAGKPRHPGTSGPTSAKATAGKPRDFERVPFNHPLYVLYSSGTTGVPKCIVHGHGGTLLQHLKEHQLHADVKPGDRVFYFTTCGWMMWNWLVSALASEATLVLYDGSPFYPDGRRLFDLADRHGVTLFGTSAKFIDAVHKAGLRPIETHDLGTVRTITSTGSPLSPESFDFVYASIKTDVHLASISGGTDIVSCFVGGVPTLPVWRGEIQAAGLGMAVEVWEHEGTPIAAGRGQGELVCTAPFPSMPVGFWNDPDGRKYHAAYFDRFAGVWCHGDWAERTTHGGFVIHGRSDATLNPGGVRIGTAEIYRQVEQLPEVLESLAVGQQWDGDERIVLFVRLREGLTLDDTLRKVIATHIRANTSPRHVPARIVQVADLPRTKSGKLVELAVRNVLHGQPVKNREALANPHALELFHDLPELQE